MNDDFLSAGDVDGAFDMVAEIDHVLTDPAICTSAVSPGASSLTAFGTDDTR